MYRTQVVLKTDGLYDPLFETSSSHVEISSFKDFFESQLHSVEVEEQKNNPDEIDSLSQLQQVNERMQ